MDTNKRNSDLSLFEGIAEKEMLMYKAVIEMVQENYDINSIKVSDITSRAGIGKGTAYEYFGSKEEIIVKALLYDTYVHILNVEKIMKSDKKFKEKYYLLMDYLEEKLPNTKATGNLIKIFMGNYEIKDNFRIEVEKIQKSTTCPVAHVEGMIDDFMEQGLKEGVLAEERKVMRRSVFATQVTGYIYCIINQYYAGEMTREEARDFSYQGLVKLLNV